MKSKFNTEDILPIGMTLVILGVAISFGMNILGDVGQTEGCSDNGHLLQDNRMNYSHIDPAQICYRCDNSTSNHFIDSSVTSTATCSNRSYALGGNGADKASHNYSATVTGDRVWNASHDASAGIGNITEKTGMIAVIVIAAVVLGIFATYLWGRFSG
jgi:hypothetical protein